MIPRALTIAGSDSGGGAGIQADLKTFHQLKVYGMSVITVLTAQNTLGVQGVYPQSPACIEEQLRSVLTDIGADAVKTGMLYSAEIITCVARYLEHSGVKQLVIDPVMIAKGGTPLLQDEAVDALRSLLLPLATVIMPNLPEACTLARLPLTDRVEDMEEVARALYALGPQYVLLKGGHLGGGDAIDLLYDGSEMLRLASPRIATRHTHGTGCTLSAALTAELAKGRTVQEAFATAKAFIDAAIGQALEIGGGIGPTHHGAYTSAG
ncbi:bifunctional hydroxymethylpyrimidine kinase/phosphomethylpyrimidine kinase [Paenibacillus sp. 1P07SE]|uniref:bifunctional hydroxymethylpyrimidine kinase/phosphomethylpyrimidine kinase n=1 Tax=Paenibacillus sp. 1P07SE TaxID=3132209 RepID=UPI0039A7351A